MSVNRLRAACPLNLELNHSLIMAGVADPLSNHPKRAAVARSWNKAGGRRDGIMHPTTLSLNG